MSTKPTREKSSRVRTGSRSTPKNDDADYVREPNRIATDTYSNPAARIGSGTPNLVNGGEYPLVRLSQNYPLILSLYRGSWIVRRVIDTIVNDMYKAFPSINTDLSPEDIKAFDTVVKKTATIKKLRSAAKWGRLFGGAAAIIVIEGHNDLTQPLEVDDVEIGAYKGLIALDRWSGIFPCPELNTNINDVANFGLPIYYDCTMNSGNLKIHHSRILKFTGRELPQWELQVELFWGMSEVELIFGA
jgi:phage-related protein (TIGR01555 family)